MEEEKIIIPDFMEKYYTGSDMEGQVILQDLASSYQKQRQNYMMTTHATQVATHRALYGGAAKEIDPEIGFASIREDFKAKAEKIALNNGYIEPQPKEQHKQEVKPQRQAFLDKLRVMREAQQGVNLNSEHKAANEDNPQKELTRREKFLSNMHSMRERQSLQHRIQH